MTVVLKQYCTLGHAGIFEYNTTRPWVILPLTFSQGVKQCQTFCVSFHKATILLDVTDIYFDQFALVVTSKTLWRVPKLRDLSKADLTVVFIYLQEHFLFLA